MPFQLSPSGQTAKLIEWMESGYVLVSEVVETAKIFFCNHWLSKINVSKYCEFYFLPPKN